MIEIEFITVQDIARITRLSKRHVAERLTKDDTFPTAYNFKGARRWDSKEFINWLNQQKG